ncbi:hypothetical protein OS242_11325 [Tumebacillus sp. DT12]|uniref:Uncharacterized protein n=1 Tax=Tumebacillus lacus TaxID=2995335 RepID=A0ABT3X0Y3_9BACL|nr:hypothetical protein [Tumebacillus lacus]MCX7570554.1 hypothetical protein [Tumebacillus lacus]
MSLWFQSPMPKKYQIFFFLWVLIVMGSFASVGIAFSYMEHGLALILFLAAILLTGIGFMIRKRVMRSLGWIEQKPKA